MENMNKKGRNDKKSCEKNCGEVPNQKKRHIVSWSPGEDDILREQIEKHGTDNWTIIAANFKDKTTRQCRRRWYTYLNSDFKKGGWSPEEDLLLCEAQKVFGNRWTEIAKVVSGRTDNAVKNRFSTLCKKRAKHEALAKENNALINVNNKRVIFPNGLNIDGVQESAVPLKKMRSYVLSTSEARNHAGKPSREYERTDQLLRPPFAVKDGSLRTEAKGMLVKEHNNNKHGDINDAVDDKAQGTFLKKDDPRILALLQQAELLRSLALKVSSEDTDQNLENAWQVLQDYLNQSKDGALTKCATPFSSCDLGKFKELVEDSSSNLCIRPFIRQPDFHTSSPSNSDHSTGSSRLSQQDYGITGSRKAERNALLLQGSEAEIHSTATGYQTDHLSASEANQENGIVVYENNDIEFSSPIQVTPLFQSVAADVPTPNFSESERRFLLSALGLESTSPYPSGNPIKAPPCKRVLLHSL